jgi:hypothetical protein
MQRIIISTILVLLVCGAVTIPRVSAETNNSNNASTQGAACVQTQLSSNINVLVRAAQDSSTFGVLANGKAFSIQAFGVQVGPLECAPILFFNNPSFGSIEVFYNSNDSIDKMIFSPPSHVYNTPPTNSSSNVSTSTNSSSTGANDNWSGYEVERYTCDVHICYDTDFTGAQVEFTVPASSAPSSHEDGNCCMDSLWIGLADESGAGDGVLAQGGINVMAAYNNPFNGYSSPVFFYEGLPSSETMFTSTCLKVSTGDNVNTTIRHGSYGGGSYQIELVYSDNDASSTCAVYVYFAYSITPTWSEYMFEATRASSCSYVDDYCQITQFTTIGYTGYWNAGGGWNGFDNPAAQTLIVNSYYIDQGIQNTAVAINSGSETQFTETWDTSQQI